jgi:predicted anti-sigma-YlaC factor YlaD
MSRPGLRQRLGCRWARRRIQRLLDADPSALLEPGEAERVRTHLTGCPPCRGLVDQYRDLGRMLGAQRVTLQPADLDVERVRAAVWAQVRDMRA